MAELKTRPTRKSAAKFVRGIGHEQRRKDAEVLLGVMQEVTGKAPVMWAGGHRDWRGKPESERGRCLEGLSDALTHGLSRGRRCGRHQAE